LHALNLRELFDYDNLSRRDIVCRYVEQSTIVMITI
jgi:hypothetical protein